MSKTFVKDISDSDDGDWKLLTQLTLSLREGGTASGGEYVFAYCTPVLTLHKSEILHIQRHVPCEIGIVRVERLPIAHRLWWSRR